MTMSDHPWTARGSFVYDAKNLPIAACRRSADAPLMALAYDALTVMAALRRAYMEAMVYRPMAETDMALIDGAAKIWRDAGLGELDEGVGDDRPV